MASPEKFGVDLGKLLQFLPESLVGRNAMAGEGLLGGGLEEELPDLSGLEAGGEIEEGAMAFTPSATAVGLAAADEALDEGGAEEIAGNAQGTKEPITSLTQREGRGAAEKEYLGQLLGQDSRRVGPRQEKESAFRIEISSSPGKTGIY